MTNSGEFGDAASEANGMDSEPHVEDRGHPAAIEDTTADADNRLASLPPPGPRFVCGFSDHMPVFAALNQFEQRELKWLWPGRVPLGTLTLLVGDPGLGKSFLTMELAARVTSGLSLPHLDHEWRDEPRPQPASVVLLSAEDEPRDTIYPRFMASGGDPQKMILLRAVSTYDNDGVHHEWQFSLEKDLAALDQLLHAMRDCRLVVIDPISAYLSNSGCNNTEMRRTLSPLAKLAARWHVAVLAVTHLNKSKYGPLVHRAIGSIALAAAARSVLAVFPHPHESRWRIVAPMKSNLSRPASALRYRIGNEWEGAPTKVIWKTQAMGESTESLVAEATKTTSANPAALEAIYWLQTMLLDGPAPAAELKRLAKSDGISERTLLRAKARMRVVSTRAEYEGKMQWVWSAREEGPPATEE